MPPPAPNEKTHRTAHRPPVPLRWPALGLIGGIVFDGRFGAGAAPYLVGLLVGVILLIWPFTRRECIQVTVVLLAFCIGGWSHAGQLRRLPADHILRYTQDVPVAARITGTVATPPRLSQKQRHLFSRWWPGAGRTAFLLDVDGVETVRGPTAATGVVKVSIKEPVLTLAVGDRVELFGLCYRSRPPDNPGQFDWAAYDRERGVFVGLTCDHRECVKRIAGAERTVITLWDRLRQRTRALLLDDMLAAGGPEATLLDTLVLGSRSAIDPRLNEAFIRIGCSHYLAVSGSNIGMIAVFVYFVGRGMGVSGRGCAGAVVVFSVLYCLIADPRPPIVRATIMSLAVCAGLLLGRRHNTLNGLSLAAVAILVVRPTQFHALDFQLSFSAIWALVYVTPWLMGIPRRLRPSVVGPPAEDDADLFVEPPARTAAGRAWHRFESWFWWMLTAAVAIWLVSVPITLGYFDRFAPWGWLSTLLLFPLVFAVTVTSFAKLLCALVWPTLGSLWTTPVQWLTRALIQAVEWLDHLPALPLRFSDPPWWLAGLAVAGVVVWAGRDRWKHGKWVSRLLAGAALLALVSWVAPARGNGRLTMTVLSVGRGMASVVELPDGRVVLCDAGAPGSFDPGDSIIVPFLRHRGIRRIDAVLLSHPNLDHFSGLPTVLERFLTGPIYVTPYFEPLSTADKPSLVLLEELRARGHPVQTVDGRSPALVFGEVTFEFLWPPPDLGGAIAANETSLVTRIRWADRSILLPGDLEALGQGRLTADADLRADVLVLPHHGSARHNTRAFVEAVGPEIVISSTSVRGAEEGPEVRSIVGSRRHHSTADDGAVTVTLDQAGTTVRTHRGGD